MVRVLVLHDSELMRSALVALLGEEPGMEVRGACWAAASAAVESLRPDVCVVDAECPSLEWMGSAVDVASTGAALVVLATVAFPRRLREACAARAMGYADKDADPRRVVEAIRRVAAGERYVAPTLAEAFSRAVEMPFTRGELRVLALAAEGAGVPEIARRLVLTVGTVRNYMAAAVRKSGGRNRIEAIRISQKEGWI
ncbi:response regulator transcription factor [Streptomyces sp. NPDC087659]|uniref:response regulator transcription factor n=1 Tax=Streptomyces sp. NPDC087659 TaxID=3365801 RepID=UPI0038252446